MAHLSLAYVQVASVLLATGQQRARWASQTETGPLTQPVPKMRNLRHLAFKLLIFLVCSAWNSKCCAQPVAPGHHHEFLFFSTLETALNASN